MLSVDTCVYRLITMVSIPLSPPEMRNSLFINKLRILR